MATSRLGPSITHHVRISTRSSGPFFLSVSLTAVWWSQIISVVITEVGTGNCGRLPTVMHGYVRKVYLVSDGWGSCDFMQWNFSVWNAGDYQVTDTVRMWNITSRIVILMFVYLPVERYLCCCKCSSSLIIEICGLSRFLFVPCIVCLCRRYAHPPPPSQKNP